MAIRKESGGIIVRNPIDIYNWTVKPHHLWDKQWLVLTGGDFHTGKYNSMIVGWGGIGTMWSKPFALIVVRSQRYTYQFIEQYDSFTLSALPEKYRKGLELIGKKSGRDFNKLEKANLTAIPSLQVSAPGIDEANLIIECRKSYWQDMDPSHFLLSSIKKHYPQKDYHRIYFGEILAISGTNEFSS